MFMQDVLVKLPQLTATESFWILLTGWITWTLTEWLYNLYLHPLKGFPGPKLAAMSKWWRVYLDHVTRERLSEKLFVLHEIYGDVVRIGPNELHFSHPSAYHQIYNSNNRWTKDPSLYHAFAEKFRSSSFSICEYTQAKKRKDLMTSFFSRRAIVNLQSLVQEKVDQLCDVLTRRHEAELESNIGLGIKAFALDTICSFCFAFDAQSIQAPGFASPVLHALHTALPMVNMLKNFPSVHFILNYLPLPVTARLNPDLKGYVNLRMILEKQIAEILANPTLLKNTSHPIVYDALINGKDTRISLDKHDLFNEAWLLIFAGTDSSSNVITLGVMHLMENPTIQQKLQQELKNVWPRLDQQPPKFEELEKLPYLKAVIKESLRLAHGVWVPATRIVPSGGLEICGKYIPGRTVVGVATIFVDMNETLFPEPHVFRPERWLEPGAENLDVVAFSKGPRSCLGINLAWCELYIAFASLSRKFKFSPCNGVSVESMKFRECYIPHYVGPPLNVVAIPESE